MCAFRNYLSYGDSLKTLKFKLYFHMLSSPLVFLTEKKNDTWDFKTNRDGDDLSKKEGWSTL